MSRQLWGVFFWGVALYLFKCFVSSALTQSSHADSTPGDSFTAHIHHTNTTLRTIIREPVYFFTFADVLLIQKLILAPPKSVLHPSHASIERYHVRKKNKKWCCFKAAGKNWWHFKRHQLIWRQGATVNQNLPSEDCTPHLTPPLSFAPHDWQTREAWVIHPGQLSWR